MGRIETWNVEAGSLTRRGRAGRSWDPNFIVGVTEPTVANTGCRIATGSLTLHTGDLTTVNPLTGQVIKPGDVISGLYVTGQIKLETGGVTLRDIYMDGADIVAPGDSYGPFIDARANHSSAGINLYEHITMNPTNLSYKNVGIQGGDFKAHRVRAHKMTDMFSPHGSSSTIKRVTIEGCYGDDFYAGPDPNQGDNITHNDWCQAAGRLSELTIVGNAVGATGRPRTSNVLLQTNQGVYSGPVSIRNNWFRGHETEGSTVNVPIELGVEFELIDNIIWSDGNDPFETEGKVLINSTTRTAPTTTISGNVYDTGGPAVIRNA